MATYAIGDIQGCYTALEALLNKIHFDPTNDTLWCTGDLVNRGPDSLQVLRFFKARGEKDRIVLGNHDLHLLAIAYGAQPLYPKDTMQEVLDAPDREALLNWLRFRPLLIHDETLNYVMTHAGLAPAWSLQQAKQLAFEIEQPLRGDTPHALFTHLYGEAPNHWQDDLRGIDRVRCIVNHFTRMRFCYPDGRLDLSYKGRIADKPTALIPWFEVVPRKNADLNIVFGHWSALEGKAETRGIFPLDTGCVWGGCLTAMQLEDRQKFSVSCES